MLTKLNMNIRCQWLGNDTIDRKLPRELAALFSLLWWLTDWFMADYLPWHHYQRNHLRRELMKQHSIETIAENIKWAVKTHWRFFLNVSVNSAISVTKIFVIAVQRFEPVTSCVRDQVATTVPTRNLWETWSLNWSQFMLQWFLILWIRWIQWKLWSFRKSSIENI